MGKTHLLLRNGGPDCAAGWNYLAPPNDTQIHLCGTTCSTIQSDPQAALVLVFGCATGEVPG